MVKLRLQNIKLAYDTRVVLEDISLGVSTGELVGIIGPNGCGKSTLIKGITKVMPLKNGQVYIDDRDIAVMPQDRMARLIAVVPQHAALPAGFTAFEVVLMGRTPHLGFLGHERHNDLLIARQAMEITNTWGLAERRVGELSGGERQRLTIARALTQQPQVILLDEPTSHLDINYQIETLELVSSLCRENGLAILAAMHDLNLASQYCDRIIMLNKGMIYAEGNASEVVTSHNVKAVYGADVCISAHPLNHLPVTLITAGCRHKAVLTDGGLTTDGKREVYR
jgi:iron complex transport system ATP-binding protein